MCVRIVDFRVVLSLVGDRGRMLMTKSCDSLIIAVVSGWSLLVPFMFVLL